ncbi:DEAD/DEAH box helicase domain protein [Bacteroides coprosuis DSM 18011]|mgnify:CR=1 FL=1|uniref:DEAD-box ATP-dependent RNA helicase RhpA n=1 Tax=Bacteroides coprosuis DSM 18011 TaxID=679937 RepID=F3ZPH8_9BACE|nr:MULTISPECIES: DEAD/DEAH box helicase [Bacteroides]EGJ71635.1 DEAD/DEAH box helicase domain protein [Bacteroides coprosuis DSM 18011]HJD91922.1 DEAD/DEAH box helicase [Bacteroides coprosuis]
MTFKELNIIEPILQALTEKGYSTPTPIQEQAILPAIDHQDILGLAQTGTGKTAAFSIPIIQHLHLDSLQKEGEEKIAKRAIRALILTPTRELAIQIGESLKDYTRYTDLQYTVIFGGVKQGSQVNRLKAGVDILVATPGRLLDLMHQGHIKINKVQHFVLDEADRMLDMGFIHDIKRLLPRLPKNRQTLFFSATMPRSIASLSRSILKNPIRIEVTPASSVVDTIEQEVYFVEQNDKKDLLVKLLHEGDMKSVLVFSRTKHGANKIVKAITKAGITSEPIHGNKSQNARQRALENFKAHKTRVLVATDIAARGIDIENLELVVNYDLPNIPETYVHRIGRTGRAGNVGKALTFCAASERIFLKDIEKLTKNKLSIVKN